jgi:hypothetical protein
MLVTRDLASAQSRLRIFIYQWPSEAGKILPFLCEAQITQVLLCLFWLYSRICG